MKMIELDAANWTTMLNFYHALLGSVGAPKWHGVSPDALADSMICGGINAVEPPYTVRIRNTRRLPKEVLDKINQVKETLDIVREDVKCRGGDAGEVEMEILP